MRDIPAFVMYCIYGSSHSSLLIESTNSMTGIGGGADLVGGSTITSAITEVCGPFHKHGGIQLPQPPCFLLQCVIILVSRASRIFRARGNIEETEATFLLEKFVTV